MTVARMNVVVTGGSGFAGYRLVEMLIERDVKTVVSFDLRLPSDDRKIDRVGKRSMLTEGRWGGMERTELSMFGWREIENVDGL